MTKVQRSYTLFSLIHFRQELVIPTHEQLHRVLPVSVMLIYFFITLLLTVPTSTSFLVDVLFDLYSGQMLLKVCNSVTCFIAAKHTCVTELGAATFTI